MTGTPRVHLASQLDPASSLRLFLAVDERRKARGWDRCELAAKTGMSQDVLNTWAYKARNGFELRIDLGKALTLLAAVGIASNRVDDLVDELAGCVTGLIEDAADLPTGPAPPPR